VEAVIKAMETIGSNKTFRRHFKASIQALFQASREGQIIYSGIISGVTRGANHLTIATRRARYFRHHFKESIQALFQASREGQTI
jgi:hypothetical protein